MKNRRSLLIAVGAAGIAGAAAWVNKNSLFRRVFLMNENVISPESYASELDENVCVVPTSQVEGPFFFGSPLRKDIREGRIGIQLNIRLAIMRGSDCQPVSGALVEIWQCDASGKYSGYPEDSTRDFWKTLNFAGIKGVLGEIHIEQTNDKTFLRGSQITDSNGIAEFTSIFPGWYEPRAPHIHVKAILSDVEQIDVQFYFEQELSDTIYSSRDEYIEFGNCPYNVHNDLSLKGKKVGGVILKIARVGEDLLATSARIGIS